jgi:hypothetical protein
MKNLIKALVVAGALSAGTLMAAPAANAYPHQSFGLYVNTGDVAFGYRDGYYDRYHRWHRWERDRDRDYWRNHYRARYYDNSRDDWYRRHHSYRW